MRFTFTIQQCEYCDFLTSKNNEKKRKFRKIHCDVVKVSTQGRKGSSWSGCEGTLYMYYLFSASVYFLSLLCVPTEATHSFICMYVRDKKRKGANSDAMVPIHPRVTSFYTVKKDDYFSISNIFMYFG